MIYPGEKLKVRSWSSLYKIFKFFFLEVTKMAEDDLETKAYKAVLSIRSKVIDISNLLSDLNMKVSHMIKDKRTYYDMLKGDDYLDYHGKI
jgi:hypothetical protein